MHSLNILIIMTLIFTTIHPQTIHTEALRLSQISFRILSISRITKMDEDFQFLHYDLRRGKKQV